MRVFQTAFAASFLAAILMGGFLSSCVFKNVNQKQMIYSTADRQEVRINLPGGQGEENFKTNLNGATEQFFTYQDSSLIYVARNTTWPTPNAARVEQTEARKGQYSVYFAGTDDKGLHWKEVHIEDFKIGYTAVTPSRLEVFDRAMSSIRIK